MSGSPPPNNELKIEPTLSPRQRLSAETGEKVARSERERERERGRVPVCVTGAPAISQYVG